MFDNLRADIRLARKENVEADWWNQNVSVFLQLGTLCVMSHRFCHWAYFLRVPVLRHPLRIIAAICKRVIRLVTGVIISPRAEIGPGLVVHTMPGVFVAPTKIGRNCFLNAGVLIATGAGQVGDDVYFGAGAKIMPGVTIGNNVLVAPNSLVLTDVPDNCTVVGVPARIRLPRQRTWSGVPVPAASTTSLKENACVDKSGACEPWTLRGLMNRLLSANRSSNSPSKS